MAKIKTNRMSVGQQTGRGDSMHEQFERPLALVREGADLIYSLSDIYSKLNSSIISRKEAEIENAVKLSKAETDAKKEENRHKEEMARIENEWKKISNAAADKEKRESFIESQIQSFRAEYEKYMVMETMDFLSDTVTARLEGLRKVIMELTKELHRD